MGCCGFDAQEQSAEELLSSYTDEEAEKYAQEVGVKPRPNETIQNIRKISKPFECNLTLNTLSARNRSTLVKNAKTQGLI